MYKIVLALLLANWCLLCSSQSTDSSLSISQDGSCGLSSNQTCLNSSFGDCCSNKGFCGTTNDFCNPTAGCQSSFGSCSTNTSYISFDGKCGSTDPNKQVCVGSTYGSCCSQKGWCGNTTDYCGTGCQSGFGTCGGADSTTETGSGTDSSSSSSISSSSTSSVSSSTLAASSSTSTSTAEDAKSGSACSNSQPSVLALEITIGVLAALLVSLAIALAFVLLRRRAKPQPAQSIVEKAETDHSSNGSGTPPGNAPIHGVPSVIEAPSPYHTYNDHRSSMSSQALQDSKQQPAELGSTGYGRAELRESYVELQDHK